MSLNFFPHDGYTVVFKRNSLIVMSPFLESALALSIGWDILWSCTLLGAEALSHTMYANHFFTSCQEHMEHRAVSPKRILNSSPM